MKLLLPTLALFLSAGPARDEVTVAFAPEDGTVLKRTFVAEAEYHLSDATLSIDGEAQEREGELPESTSKCTELISVTDRIDGVADGRPTRLVRTFDDLEQDSSDTGAEGEDVESSLSSSLEGRQVRFTWDDEDERYDVEAADDEDLDSDVAEWLLEDMDLRLALPPKAVEPGDEWELDPKLYLAFMWPSGLLDFRPPESADAEDEDDNGRAGSIQTIEGLKGEGTARLEEVREEDGVKVAVIHVELSIETGSHDVLPAIDEEEFARPEIALETEIERTVEGTILWDLEHGHALGAELDCEASRLQSQKWTVTGERDGEEVSAEIERAILFEGTIHYSATIERE